MTTRPHILIASDRVWRIGALVDAQPVVEDVLCESQENSDSAIHAIETLRDRQLDGGPLVLSVPSSWCLSATITTERLPRQQRRSAMSYRLEEKLPVAIEDLTADFLKSNGRALGVAVETARLRTILDALDGAGAGVTVESVVPTSFLALRSLMEGGEKSENDIDAVLLGDDDGVDLFVLQDGFAVAWRCMPVEERAVRLHLNALAIDLGRTPRLAIAGGGKLRPLLDACDVEAVAGSDEDVASLATRAAFHVARGRLAPLINLRCDALVAPDRSRQIRRPLHAALLAACVALASLIGVMHWQAGQYEQQASRFDEQQRRSFRQAYPTGKVPSNPRLRLESELKAVKGQSGQTDQTPSRTSALAVLHRALSRMPTDLRFRMLEIRIDGERLYLDGQARSHSDADAVAAALRSRLGFDIQPPRTEALRDERGVSFTITGAVAAEEPPALADTRP